MSVVDSFVIDVPKTKVFAQKIKNIWGKLLAHTDIGAALDVLQERTDLRGTLSDVSRALDEYLVRVLEKARFSMDDPANVLLYLLTKEAEARNLRIVLVCVASGLNREFARRLLSHVR